MVTHLTRGKNHQDLAFDIISHVPIGKLWKICQNEIVVVWDQDLVSTYFLRWCQRFVVKVEGQIKRGFG